MRNIILSCCFILSISINSGFSQSDSTTDLFSTSIDTVLSLVENIHNDNPILIYSSIFYRKNIKTYRGKYNTTYLQGFKYGQKEWAGKRFTYIDISPITFSQNNLIIILRVGDVNYKSSKKWKLNPKELFFYTIYRFDPETESYKIKEVIQGKICPDTTN